tara:strand:+ start:1023 stop:1292 length:270 start_codon:yes stop_codon:yes gene_type:complete
VIDMIQGITQIVAITAAGALVAGVTIAVIGKEVLNENQSVEDKAKSSLVKIGYFSEGMLKGAIVSLPVCVVVLLGVNYGLRAQNRLVGA